MLKVCLVVCFMVVNIVAGNTGVPNTVTTTIITPLLGAEEQIIEVLEKHGYSKRMQRIILAQAIHESGNFTNRLTRKWNNVFAINYEKKDTVATSNKGFAEGRTGWATYRSVSDATRGYIIYTSRRNYPRDTTLMAYVDFLKRRNYFTADKVLYYNAMKSIISKQEGKR